MNTKDSEKSKEHKAEVQEKRRSQDDKANKLEKWSKFYSWSRNKKSIFYFEDENWGDIECILKESISGSWPDKGHI